MGDLAKLIISTSNKKALLASDSQRKRPSKSEVERLLCDNTLIHKLTGWTPKVSLEKGLLNTIAWFKDAENLKKYKSDIYNV